MPCTSVDPTLLNGYEGRKMNSEIDWPDGKDFAFTIFDDPIGIQSKMLPPSIPSWRIWDCEQRRPFGQSLERERRESEGQPAMNRSTLT
jgi:hypothetical protein